MSTALGYVRKRTGDADAAAEAERWLRNTTATVG
jgi:hypothetical protein